jgi:branched-chain amino acid transport system substrate-binding protein
MISWSNTAARWIFSAISGLFCILAATGQAGESIKIGVVSQVTGSFAEFGQLTINGVKLAQEEINRRGGVLGRQLELRIEDTQSTNPGTVLAFSKLFSDPTTAAAIGPIFSSQVQSASPTIAKAGIPTMIGGAAPVLTQLDITPGSSARAHTTDTPHA